MAKWIKTERLGDIDTNIKITMYLRPIIYGSSDVFGAVTFDSQNKKYHTDINPARVINGPLSGPGEELEPPISKEWDSFIQDCKFVVEEAGFVVIQSERSSDSNKSEYILLYGMDDAPCGTLVFDLRLSDHPFDATFPEKYKDKALEYLKENKILDGTATKAGIDFQIESIVVGLVKNDSWDRAINRLYNLLSRIRTKIRIRNKRDSD